MRRGRDLDNPDRPELGHFERCQACGQLFDVRDLGQVVAHLHEQEIETLPAPPIRRPNKTSRSLRGGLSPG